MRMVSGYRSKVLLAVVIAWPIALLGAGPPANLPVKTPANPPAGPLSDPLDWCQYPAPKAKPAAIGPIAALIGVGEVEPNSTPGTAQVIPFGDGVGQDRDIDVTGTIGTTTDLDYFRLTATKGDVLGLAVLAGGAPDSMVAVTDLAGVSFTENDDHQGQAGYYPPGSPLPGGVNSLDSTMSWVVPADGDYLIRVKSFNGTSSGDYTLQLRGPRPFLEVQPPGTTQIIFVDFNGASINAVALFGGGNNPANLSGLSSYMTRWGLTAGDQNAVIDSILATINENFDDLRTAALNGDRDTDGIAGHFDVDVRNSRDHADPFGQPFVSRLIVGGDIAQLGISTIGIAEDIDPGNFGPEATAVILLDLLSAASPDPNSINSIPRDASMTKIAAVGLIVGNISSHEAGHYLGNWHTLNSNATRSIMDAGGNLPINMGGVGTDGILGTGDDQQVDFSIDAYGGLQTGNERTNVRTAFALATGAAGCTVDPDCADGAFCNGAETCLGGVCQAGSNPCTLPLLCRESDDLCVNCLSNANCDDGLFCNGPETCNGAGNCQAGSNPCTPLPCDEPTDSCVGGAEVWMSFDTTTTVPSPVGTVENEDIVARNVTSGAWSLIFDGSDVGLSGFVIDGMARLSSGDILLSFTASGSIAGMTGGPGGSTTLDDSDIVRFVPGTLGANTTGSFVFYFDGSDVGLTTNNEDIDAITLTSSGQLAISTIGSVTATGASGNDADLLVFTATSLGEATVGSFAVYFDGSDVGLSDGGSEDLDAAGLRSTGALLLSTLGTVSVPGVAAEDEDVLSFTGTFGPTTSGTYTLFLDLSALGIATGEDVTALEYKE